VLSFDRFAVRADASRFGSGKLGKQQNSAFSKTDKLSQNLPEQSQRNEASGMGHVLTLDIALLFAGSDAWRGP
jgi:hypothetical protein